MIAAVKKSSVRLIAAVHLAGRRAPGHNTPALRRSLRAAPRVRDGLLRRLLLRQPLFILQQLLYGRCIPIASSNSKELEINERIRDKEIRLIGADGSQMGIMSPRDALRMAMDQDLDLVKVAPQAKPPVCKILDYGKYRFEMQKREKEAKKNQKVVEVKEIRLSLNIDIGDFNTKVNQAKKFLDKGDKLKVSLRLRGREMAHSDLGVANMQRFAQALGEEINVDKAPKLEGRQILMFLSKKPAK